MALKLHYLLGVLFKIFDKHPYIFNMRVSPMGPNVTINWYLTDLTTTRLTVQLEIIERTLNLHWCELQKLLQFKKTLFATEMPVTVKFFLLS